MTCCLTHWFLLQESVLPKRSLSYSEIDACHIASLKMLMMIDAAALAAAVVLAKSIVPKHSLKLVSIMVCHIVLVKRLMMIDATALATAVVLAKSIVPKHSLRLIAILVRHVVLVRKVMTPVDPSRAIGSLDRRTGLMFDDFREQDARKEDVLPLTVLALQCPLVKVDGFLREDLKLVVKRCPMKDDGVACLLPWFISGRTLA